MENNLFDIRSRLNSVADVGVSALKEVAVDAVERFTSGIPKVVTPTFYDEEEDGIDEQPLPKMEAPPEPEPVTKNSKRTLEELETKARNKANLVKEMLSIVDSAAKVGVSFSGLEKKDREIVKHWDELLLEHPNLVVSVEYLEAKARVEQFEEEISKIRTTDFDDNVTEMVYEAFLFDYIEKNKENGIKPQSPFTAIVEAVIIICGASLKVYVFNKLLSVIRKIK